MPRTPSKMHIYDMVTIDTIVFEIVGGGGGGVVNCLKYPGSDRVKCLSLLLHRDKDGNASKSHIKIFDENVILQKYIFDTILYEVSMAHTKI